MNGIVGGQHGSTALHHFVQSNFPRARREAHDTQESVYLHSSINKHNYTAIKYAQLLCITRHETSQNPPLLINTQHYSSRCNMEADAAYQGCLPSCELHIHSRSLTFRRTGKVECACKLRKLEIAHVSYAISRLAAQSGDWNTISGF